MEKGGDQRDPGGCDKNQEGSQRRGSKQSCKEGLLERRGIAHNGRKKIDKSKINSSSHIPKVEIYLVQETKNPLQNSDNQLFIWDNEQKVSHCSAPIKLAGGFCPY